MTNVIFSGSVSAQVTTGEIVTITITAPDSTTETLEATTLADTTFSVSKNITIPGDYSAMFHIDADAQFTAANVGPIPFTIGLQLRTLTVKVTVV